MSISIFFSFGMYKVLTIEVERFARIQQFRLEKEPRGIHMAPPPDVEFHYPISDVYSTQLVNDIKRRIILNLLATNLVILSLSAILGYLLSGKTLKPIKQMVDEQNRFITDASHELRTPLTALKSSMEVFLMDPKTDVNEAKTLIKESINDVDNLTALSDSLLQLAQYEKPNGNLKMEEMSILESINEALNKLEPLAKNKHISISKNEDDYKIVASKNAIKDVFKVLIENAIKYSNDGGKIEITAKKSDGYVQISIKDDGIGIDQKDISHIFDRFYRADKSRSDSKRTGYGLGLSIAKRIVDNHKGNISVESIINKGSTFTVKLPVKATIVESKHYS